MTAAAETLGCTTWAPKGFSGSPNILVFLHGLGGEGASMYRALQHALPRNLPSDFLLVAPDAPIIMPHGGCAWYYQIKDDTIRLPLLMESLKTLHTFLQELVSDLNPKSICLAGFSQGGTVSVSYPLVYPYNHVDYFGCFSGYVPLDLPIASPLESGYGRFLWGHGTQDYENPYRLAEIGLNTLRSLGVTPTHLHAPIGHTMAPEWLERLFAEWME